MAQLKLGEPVLRTWYWPGRVPAPPCRRRGHECTGQRRDTLSLMAVVSSISQRLSAEDISGRYKVLCTGASLRCPHALSSLPHSGQPIQRFAQNSPAPTTLSLPLPSSPPHRTEQQPCSPQRSRREQTLFAVCLREISPSCITFPPSDSLFPSLNVFRLTLFESSPSRVSRHPRAAFTCTSRLYHDTSIITSHLTSRPIESLRGSCRYRARAES
jgi:hypothetical protein